MGAAVPSRAMHSAAEPEHLFLAGDVRWQLAQRIAASEIFARSEFLPKFLLHICELSLQGKTGEIKEQQIGVRVFNRPPSYNPGDDNIVRNYAVQLRKRLSLYFEREGQHEPFTIEIPRGGYVPVFHPRVTSVPTPLPTTAVSDLQEFEHPEAMREGPLPDARRQADWRMFFTGLGVGAVLFVAVALAWKMQHAEKAVLPVTHPLWSAIFTGSRDTLIVPADSGLGILQNLTEEPANLTNYLNGEYFANVQVKGLDQGNLDDLRMQRYTSIVDLHITSRLSHLPEVVPDHLILRYARDLRMDDLKNSNVILLGAIHTNPWVSLLQRTLNFQFVCGRRVNDCYILNSHPSQGELAMYRSDLNGASQSNLRDRRTAAQP